MAGSYIFGLVVSILLFVYLLLRALSEGRTSR